MESTNVNAILDAVVARERKTVKAYGAYYGEQLHTVESWNPDLGFEEDRLAGKNTLIRPIKLFRVKSINILGVKVVLGLNNEPKIEFNDDSKLRFDVVPPTFKDVSIATVKDAVEAFENKKAPIFFASKDLNHLAQEIVTANEAAMRTFEELAKKYMNLAGTARQVNDETRRNVEEYRRQLGMNAVKVETVTHITAEINE